MTLPNWITAARIATIPIFLVLSYMGSDAAAVWAFALFVAASASDLVDGYIARRDATESRTGKFLDPLADKLLVAAALVVLVTARAFPLWAALVIGVREVAVQILRIRIVRSGGDLPASPAAKAKTMLQILMVGWWLLPFEVSLVHWGLLAAALVATVWSGLEYFQVTKQREAVG